MEPINTDLMLWMDADPLATAAEVQWWYDLSRIAANDDDADDVEELSFCKCGDDDERI